MTSDLDPYKYDLPEDRIADRPLEKRDSSKLLVYKDKTISHQRFTDAINFIPNGATVFFNNTKVIAARLYFLKSTGAKIEVFLTEPIEPFADFQKAFTTKNSCTWKCIIGNLKKWKEKDVLSIDQGRFNIKAILKDRDQGLVHFEWTDDVSFLEIIEQSGHIPLPPYLNREEETEDKERYQTVFSKLEGAVAAPTAGLHFTAEFLDQMDQAGIIRDELTLHVSAGTFRPIKVENFEEHDMHNEKIILSKKNIESIIECKGPVFAVGTTALRTLESLYWYGTMLLKDPKSDFRIAKDTPYLIDQKPNLHTSLKAVLEKLKTEGKDEIYGETEIFIYPGYEFKVVDGLFTNFHMPGSTLILLVAAFVGNDWKKIYQEALTNNYRFLSYGDTSLLFRHK